MNAYHEAKLRVWDASLWFWEECPSRRIDYSYKESDESCKTPGTGVITYPCCPFCGKRMGNDNNKFFRGSFCDYTCNIAWEIKINKKDFSNEEAIREAELRQMQFLFTYD